MDAKKDDRTRTNNEKKRGLEFFFVRLESRFTQEYRALCIIQVKKKRKEPPRVIETSRYSSLISGRGWGP